MVRADRKWELLLGCAHFFVDFACTALLTAGCAALPRDQVLACALIYNGLAFAFQLPIGALGDLLGLRRGLAAVGCGMVALGALIPTPVGMCLVIGLGNACFHIGGGREALIRGRGKAAAVGRFVAPGALGIFLGPRMAGLGWLTFGVLPACLLGLMGWLLATRKGAGEVSAPGLPTMGRLRWGAVMGCMFLTVLLRSYMGTVLKYDFLANGLGALVFTLGIFGGKFFGGSLGDRFGDLRLSALAQIGAAVLLAASVVWPVLAFPGIFLFNTSMAITAVGLYRCLPGYPGTMFGLTTFALYLGVLPKLLGWSWKLFSLPGVGILGGLSAGLLLAGLALAKGGGSSGGKDRDIPAEIPGTDPLP